MLVFSYLPHLLLRRPDSNERPLGYEPNELPTAPLRDILYFRVQSYCIYLKKQIIVRYFFYFLYC